MPRNVKAGQYLAGLSIAVPREASKRDASRRANQAGFEISLQAQRLIAVEVDIAGAWAPKLVVGGVAPVARGDMIDLEVSIGNRGNAFALGRGVVTVADTGLRNEFAIATFVPDTAIKMLVPWTRNALVGDHAVEVVLTYDDGQRATWNGTVRIDEALRAQLNKALRVSTPSTSSAKSGLSSVTVASGAASVATCCALAVRLRRRRKLTWEGARASA